MYIIRTHELSRILVGNGNGALDVSACVDRESPSGVGYSETYNVNSKQTQHAHTFEHSLAICVFGQHLFLAMYSAL